MPNITPPKYVKQILIKLRSHGHLAYLVGGCVRDILLGVYPNDWDICTSALPQQVLEIFPQSAPTGLKHGTVTVGVNGRQVEVTTFRAEGSYADHRHPDAVSFVCDLNTDLSRRDFTMNALALPPDGLIADPFGGVEDIEKRLIRCVGEPDRRFDEDALRMLRALRFSARLGFEIESETMAGIIRNAPLAAALAPERVRDELEKILLTKQPELAGRVIEYGLLDRYLLHRTVPENAAQLKKLPNRALPRWAGLCVMLEGCGAIDSAESFLMSLRLDSRTVRCCTGAAELLRQGVPEKDVDWKRALSRRGVDCVQTAAQCSDMLCGTRCEKRLKAILKSGECFSVKHLAVSGDDLLELGLRGRALGEMLSFLLDYVMEYPQNNRRELLLTLARGTED